MLLRRISEHVRNQNWFAVGVDLAIVIVGVFIGIQVSNWNEQNALDAEQDRYLQQLSAEYQAIEANLDNQVTDYRAFVASSGRVLEVVRGEGPVDPDAMWADLKKLDSGRIPPGPPPTLQELISSGKVDLIDNHALRTQLLTAHAQAETITRIFDLIRRGLHEPERVVYFHTDYRTDLPSLELESLTTSPIMPPTPEDIAAMRADPALEAAVENFYGAHLNMLQVELQVLEQVRKLNALLAEELGEAR
ncbi:hypothetical protein HK107_01465 [Parvularcula sp. ZS-1/3]|uniref:Uncharacterized protein n=1 Tax=Parvularcula mediterranea TaxID=2732508 RepID=A0A7Y3W4A0_9PROT|nr:hypothetical protein [Parvularcula mediterranea]NNU14991.1 hypothetical protein [Parvularcula mediterranea]